MTPINEPIVRSLWAEHPEVDATIGLTAMTHCTNDEPEEQFMAYLDTIDLHHGPLSTSEPYTGLKVLGASLTPGIQAALSLRGFVGFALCLDGFEATRTSDDAMLIHI